MDVGYSEKYSKRYWTSILFQICLMFLCICSEKYALVAAEGRRPLYIIAHMVNSVYELDEYLGRGANAIEADITFNNNGTIRYVYHGYPCDCYRVCDERENFATYLNYVRDVVNPNHVKYQKSLTFLFLDLKLSEVSRSRKYKAGEEIAKHLITNLWNNDLSEPKIRVLLSVGHTSDSETVKAVRETFTKSNRRTAMNKLGFDVGLNDDLNNIRRMWSKLGVTVNRWQGDGITNCLRLFRDDSRLRQAIRIRDSDKSYIDKVYDWTVDMTAHIRSSLRLGVDGILTNFPERVVAVLQEKEFRDKYRLATPDDNPFSRVQLAPLKSSYNSPNLNLYVSSMRELTIAALGYAWDFYKLRLKRPATLFPLLQELFARALPSIRKYKSTVKRRQRSGVLK